MASVEETDQLHVLSSQPFLICRLLCKIVHVAENRKTLISYVILYFIPRILPVEEAVLVSTLSGILVASLGVG